MHKRILSVLLAVALVFTIAGVTMAAQFPGGEEPSPRVIGLGPEWSGFLDINEWNFHVTLVTSSPKALEARIIGTQIGGRFVAGLVEDEWTGVVFVGKQMEHRLDKHERLHRLLIERRAQLIGKWGTGDFEQKIREEYRGIHREIGNIFAELAEAGKKTNGITVFMPSVTLNLGETIVVELVFEVRETHDPTRRHQITFPTSVTKLPPLAVEADSVWIPGDLHIHSIYSDGDHNLYHLRDTEPNMKGRGYDFVYVADHVGYDTTKNLQRTVCLCVSSPCGVASTWQCYVTNTQRVTQPGIAFFPGAELNLAHTTWWGQAPEGHALIYGQNNLVRSDGLLLFGGQITAADLLTLKPTGSQLGIAHPETTWFGCKWVRCSRHYPGAETMCPGHFDEISWWRDRAFTAEALADAVAGSPVLSVRTGSDYHGPSSDHPETRTLYQAYTYVRIPITYSEWQAAAWSTRRGHVDTALYSGRTVASRSGCFARLTIDGKLPGSVLRNVPAGTTLTANVLLRPLRTDTYRIQIWQNGRTQVVDHSVSGVAGEVITLNFALTFPGETHGYWMCVTGGDIIYSSPIIVTDSP